MEAKSRKPRTPKAPQSCRYCGFVSDAHRHERGLMGVPSYECRDAVACGDRIRSNKAAKGIPADTSDIPF